MEQHTYIPAERQKRMIEYIEANTSAQIHELAACFGVSEATVRRDLDEMDHRGRMQRTPVDEFRDLLLAQLSI